MDEQRKSKHLLPFALFVALILAIIVISSFEMFREWFGFLWSILAPIATGLLLAYICNPFFRVCETKLFFNIPRAGFRRFLSLLVTYLLLTAAFSVILFLIIPQLFNNLFELIANYESYMDTAIFNVNRFLGFLNNRIAQKELISLLDPDVIKEDLNAWITEITPTMDSLRDFFEQRNLLSQFLFGIAKDMYSVAKNLLLGFFISLYVLSSKEKLYAQFTRMCHALFGNVTNEHILHICKVTDRSFGRFLLVQTFSSLFVGTFTYLMAMVFRVPFASVIGAVAGVCSFVPVVGSILSMILISVFLFLVAPDKILPMLLTVLFLLILNKLLIRKKLMPYWKGVNALCIVLSVSVCGGIWGVPGIILGIPALVTVIEVVRYYSELLLKRKSLPGDTAYYYAPDLGEYQFSSDAVEHTVLEKQVVLPKKNPDIYDLAKQFQSQRKPLSTPAHESTENADSEPDGTEDASSDTSSDTDENKQTKAQGV